MTTLELPTTTQIVTTSRPPGVWRRVSDVGLADLSQPRPYRS